MTNPVDPTVCPCCHEYIAEGDDYEVEGTVYHEWCVREENVFDSDDPFDDGDSFGEEFYENAQFEGADD